MPANNYFKLAIYGASENGAPRAVSYVFPFNNMNRSSVKRAVAATQALLLETPSAAVSVWRPVAGFDLPLIGDFGGLK